jgi:predicted Zn-dependent protease
MQATGESPPVACLEKIMFKTKRQKRAISLIKRGLLTTQKALNNQQRLAHWYWKQGSIKQFEQEFMK